MTKYANFARVEGGRECREIILKFGLENVKWKFNQYQQRRVSVLSAGDNKVHLTTATPPALQPPSELKETILISFQLYLTFNICFSKMIMIMCVLEAAFLSTNLVLRLSTKTNLLLNRKTINFSIWTAANKADSVQTKTPPCTDSSVVDVNNGRPFRRWFQHLGASHQPYGVNPSSFLRRSAERCSWRRSVLEYDGSGWDWRRFETRNYSRSCREFHH